MHPILFRVGPLPIYSYGTMLALAFLVGIALAQKRSKKMGIDPNLILDLSIYILIGALVGSRLLYVATDWSNYREAPLNIIKIWEGGLAFQGGLFGAVIVSFWYLKRKKISPWKVGDIIIPSAALGHAIGRIGCFLNGCCYGKPTGLPWGVTFPPGSFAANHFGIEHHLHPVQLYSMLINVIIFIILIKFTSRAKYVGQVFWLYGILYGAGRFGLEFLRAEHQAVLFFLNIYQLISIGLLALSLIMLKVLSR